MRIHKHVGVDKRLCIARFTLRVCLCEIEFNISLLKTLEVCQIISENLNEDDKCYANVL